MAVILLCDNGSVRPNATLQLRQLAKKLSDKTGLTIYPVSFKHADRIDASELGGDCAYTFHHFMTQQLSEGQRDFILLPLFFGNSKALTSFVPDEVSLLEAQFGTFTLNMADVIYPLPEGDALLTDIIIEYIQQTSTKLQLPLKNIVLVDHGSPIPRVTAVRKHLAQTVQEKLPADVKLEEAVMERREGKKYDFNGDLLKDWLVHKAQQGETCAIVVLLFFLPGRHAGEGGDIVEICNEVMDQFPDFKIGISPLITEHVYFIDILENRLKHYIQG